MDVLKQVWQRIEEFFKRLSPSQRLTLGTLAAVVAVALWSLVSVAGKDTLAPLTKGDTPPDVTAKIQTYLREQGVTFDVQGGIVYVPASRRDTLWFELQGENKPMAGEDVWKWLQTDFDFSTRDRNRERYYHSRAQQLEHWIARMDAVQFANVAITAPPDANTMPLTGQRGTASVIVQLRQGKTLERGHVMAIANLVSHAVETLEPQAVAIADTQGHFYKVPGPGQPFELASEIVQAKTEQENAYKKKILEILSFVRPDPLVSVNVEMDFDPQQEEETHPLVAEAAPDRERRAKETTTGTTEGRRPGGVANFGEEVGPTVALATSADRSASDIQYRNGLRNVRRQKVAPRIISVTGSVILPQKTVKEQKLVVDDVKTLVAKAIGVTQLLNLEVKEQPYPEPPAIVEPPAWSEAVAFLRESWDKIALGILILVALGMIYGIVQRAIPRDISAEIERIRAQLAAQAQEEVVAVEGGGDVRVAQMRQTVKEVVQKNPRSVAGILRRWMTRS